MNSINWARIAGAGAVLRRRRAGTGRAGPRGGIQCADRQFRQCAGRLGGAAHGAAGGAVDRRLQPQRYPRPLPGGQRHVDGAGRAIAVAQHGHPGQLELRADAVRIARSRPGRDRQRDADVPRDRADDGAGYGLAPRAHRVAWISACDDAGSRRKSGGCIKRPAILPIRTPRSASPPRGLCRRRRPWSPWRWRRRIRPSFPMRSSKRWDGGRRCRHVWRICTIGRSGSWCCRMNSARWRRRVRALTRRNMPLTGPRRCEGRARSRRRGRLRRRRQGSDCSVARAADG